MSVVPSLPSDTVTIRPWPDEVIDSIGFDPRSCYVETYWLGILGPSTTWLLRRLAAWLEAEPAGFDLPLAETAQCLGLGFKGGRTSPFMRALSRCVQFDMAQLRDDKVLAVRRKLPPLNRRQLMQLPPLLQAEHAKWQQSRLEEPAIEQMRRRSRQLALSLLELGEDLEATERQLMRWRFHPALCRESAAWAWKRHLEAAAAAAQTQAPPA